jgi:hypothetical protein
MIQAEADAARLRAFEALTAEQRADTIRELSRNGLGDYEIANATRLSVEMVRRIIADPQP